MEKIKYKWDIVSLELLTVVLATLVFTGTLPFYTIFFLLIFLLFLVRKRSIVAPFIAVFLVLLVVWNVQMGRLREEPDFYLREEMGKSLRALSMSIADRIAEDEKRLVSVSASVIESGILGGDMSARPDVFDIITGEMEDGDGRGIALFDQDLEWIAWSGKIRGINAGKIKEAFERDPEAYLIKGAVFTILTMTYPLKGTGGDHVGVLFLSDLLSVESSLEQVALVHEGFMDALDGGGGKWGELVPSGLDETVDGGISVEAFGKRIAYLKPPSTDEIEALLHSKERSRKLTSLLLLLPWLYVIGVWLRKLDGLTVWKIEKSKIPYLWMLFGLSAIGLLILLLRVALLWMGIPGDLWETGVFSPNLFASGLLDTGSRSIGDFFISSFFILILAYWFLLRARSVSMEGKGLRWSVLRVITSAVAILIPAAAPFVLTRLLRDTSMQLLIYGRPFESLEFALWESSIFILLLSALFVSAALLVTAAGSLRGRRIIPLSIYVLAVGLLFYLLIQHPEQSSSMLLSFTLSVGAVAASFVISSFATAESRLAKVAGSYSFMLAGLFLASILTYPVILEKRQKVLIGNAVELFEIAQKPIDTWVTFVLEEFIEDTEKKEPEILDDLASRELAFALWASSFGHSILTFGLRFSG
jgi:hypothetical protein